jgi:hypothetical protein
MMCEYFAQTAHPTGFPEQGLPKKGTREGSGGGKQEKN